MDPHEPRTDEEQARPEVNRPAQAGQAAPSRRAYHSPALTQYGSIAKLTQSGGATQLEGASGRNRME